MKKIILSSIVLLFITNLLAQKNTLLVYGNIGYENKKEGFSDTKANFSFAPGIGYQFHKKWTTGIRFQLASSKQIRTNPGEENSFTYREFGLGPFLRYTKILNNTFSIFGQIEGGFGAAKDKYNGTITDEYRGFQSNIFPAIAINVHKGLALNFDIGGIAYNWSKYKDGYALQKTVALNFGKTVNIGISKNFNFKKETKPF
jgi:hypothetical protein